MTIVVTDYTLSLSRGGVAMVDPRLCTQSPSARCLFSSLPHTPWFAVASGPATQNTRSSAIADGPRDASCQLKFCLFAHFLTP